MTDRIRLWMSQRLGPGILLIEIRDDRLSMGVVILVFSGGRLVLAGDGGLTA